MKDFHENREKTLIFPQKEPFCASEGIQAPIFFLPIGEICVEKQQKRGKAQNRIIREAQKMRKYGLCEPLLVRAEQENAYKIRYILAENTLRWQAACRAQIDRVPCILQRNEGEIGEIDEIFTQIRAKQPDIFALAAAYRYLLRTYGITQEEIARKCGVSQSSIANKLRLLRFSEGEKRQILEAGLGERHARALLRITDEGARAALLSQTIRKRLTVAQTEELVESALRQKAPSCAADPAVFSPKTAFSPPNTAFSPAFEGFSPHQVSTQPISKQAQNAEIAAPCTCNSAPNHTASGRQKIAIQSLEPLYTSLDRPLAILRRAGCKTEMQHREEGDEVTVTIRIRRN